MTKFLLEFYINLFQDYIDKKINIDFYQNTFWYLWSRYIVGEDYKEICEPIEKLIHQLGLASATDSYNPHDSSPNEYAVTKEQLEDTIKEAIFKFKELHASL